MRIKLEAKGLDKLIGIMEGLPGALGEGVKKGLDKAGAFVAQRVQDNVPIDTGDLMRSIHHTPPAASENYRGDIIAGEYETEIVTDKHYGVKTHEQFAPYGTGEWTTRRQEPTPEGTRGGKYMTRVVENSNNLQKIEKTITDAIDKETLNVTKNIKVKTHFDTP